MRSDASQQLIRLLFRPSEFFRERASRPADRRTPGLLVTTALVPSILAEVLARPTDKEVGLAAELIGAVLVGLLLSPLSFVISFWLPLRLLAGSFARPWESGGYSQAPVAIGGLLMMMAASAAPDLYAARSIWFLGFFGLWNLVVLYRALLIYVPEDRARFALGGCMVMAVLLNIVSRAMASFSASAR